MKSRPALPGRPSGCGRSGSLASDRSRRQFDGGSEREQKRRPPSSLFDGDPVSKSPWNLVLVRPTPGMAPASEMYSALAYGSGIKALSPLTSMLSLRACAP